MRVALTSVHCWPDVRRGGERYLHELSAALHRAGHDVTVLSTGTSPGRGTVLGVPVHRLPVRTVPRSEPIGVELAFGAQALAHLGPAALRAKVDVWHATSTADAAAAALVGGRVRTVFTDHGFPARASRDKRPDRRLHRYVAGHIGSYVCVSEAAAGYLQSDYGRQADVVSPGVNVGEHTPGTRERRPTVLYSGSLTEPRKGVQQLVEAAALLRRTVPALQVWLLGPGVPPFPLDPELVTRCVLVDDATLRSAYAAAWVTALPSTAESFGMTVVESLASGTPVVVRADGGGSAEIVSDPAVGRRSGPTTEELAASLGEALDLAALPATVEAARAHALRYDWDAAVVPKLLEVYER
jgi:glycosyltransferase involved in cell wall biosynthesis